MAEKIILVNKDEIVEKGQRIYETIKDKLEPEHKGEIVAIEPDTGDYFLGQSVIEAIEKGREKYPDSVFHVIRIGYPVVHVFR
ncbi:MAG: hypothetical protein ACE5MB_04900 [Anaerolineae bacterium]